MIRILIEHGEHFICRLKEDTGKACIDQATFWSGKGVLMALNLQNQFGTDWIGSIEHWFFIHGWAILLFGRLLILAIDGFKRVRDFNKPEWKNIVTPVLKKEAVEERKKTALKKFLEFLKLGAKP